MFSKKHSGTGVSSETSLEHLQMFWDIFGYGWVVFKNPGTPRINIPCLLFKYINVDRYITSISAVLTLVNLNKYSEAYQKTKRAKHVDIIVSQVMHDWVWFHHTEG